MYQHYAKKQVPGFLDLENTLVFQKKKTLIQAFLYSNFNYCPLVWHVISMRSTNKTASIQKRALRMLFNNYATTYDSLLAKANKPSTEIKRY